MKKFNSIEEVKNFPNILKIDMIQELIEGKKYGLNRIISDSSIFIRNNKIYVKLTLKVGNIKNRVDHTLDYTIYYIEEILRKELSNLIVKNKQEKILKSDMSNYDIILKYINSKKYSIWYHYDFLGVLDFIRVNKKSITCEDSTFRKYYLNKEKINKLFREGLRLSTKEKEVE